MMKQERAPESVQSGSNSILAEEHFGNPLDCGRLQEEFRKKLGRIPLSEDEGEGQETPLNVKNINTLRNEVTWLADSAATAGLNDFAKFLREKEFNFGRTKISLDIDQPDNNPAMWGMQFRNSATHDSLVVVNPAYKEGGAGCAPLLLAAFEYCRTKNAPGRADTTSPLTPEQVSVLTDELKLDLQKLRKNIQETQPASDVEINRRDRALKAIDAYLKELSAPGGGSRRS